MNLIKCVTKANYIAFGDIHILVEFSTSDSIIIIHTVSYFRPHVTVKGGLIYVQSTYYNALLLSFLPPPNEQNLM